MNAFIATVTINGLTVDYQIFLIGKKFKAILKQTHFAKYIPYQLDFWREKEVWKSHHPLAQQVIDQFGSIINNQLRAQKVQNSENPSAA